MCQFSRAGIGKGNILLHFWGEEPRFGCLHAEWVRAGGGDLLQRRGVETQVEKSRGL